MCGIIVKENEEIKNIDKLNHRGGDSAVVKKMGNYTFAHNRLKLTGDLIQPIENSGIIAVVNGEFYDYKKYLEEFDLKSECDSEIIIPLYKKYGLDFINHLNGEFAFVIYDSVEDVLIFGRDPFGIKPLYYRNEKNLEIASEIKVFEDLEFSNLEESLTMQYSQKPIFNLNEVEPGTICVYKKGNITKKKYAPYKIGSKNNTIREELIQAVKKRIGEQKVAITLSGGIDSALISSIAAKILNKEVETFSVAFVGDDRYNEVEDIKKIIKHNKIKKHNILYLDMETLFDNLEEAVVASEGISVNIHVAAKYLLFKEIAKKGYKINLSGEGSDELFWGYQHLISEVKSVEVPEVLKGYMNSSGKDNNYSNLLDVPEFLKGKFEIGNMLHEIFLNKKEIKKIIFNTDLKKPYLSHKLWLNLAFTPYILNTLGDKIEMSHNIEGRLPFLDKNVIEKAFDTKLENKLNKIQLKNEFSDILPSFLIEKPKHPFIGPQLLANENVKVKIKRLVSQEFNSERFNIEEIISSIDKYSGNITFNSAMMIALSIHYLEKKYIKNK